MILLVHVTHGKKCSPWEQLNWKILEAYIYVYSNLQTTWNENIRQRVKNRNHDYWCQGGHSWESCAGEHHLSHHPNGSGRRPSPKSKLHVPTVPSIDSSRFPHSCLSIKSLGRDSFAKIIYDVEFTEKKPIHSYYLVGSQDQEVQWERP